MSPDTPPAGPPREGRRDFLLPVLPIGSGPPDPVAIATWQLAASDAIGAELPHDLLALWLYPASGGVVLLGPSALADDQVEVPRPDRFLGQEQLLALEDRFRRAGYASVIAAPIRDQDRDLGLLLLAAIAAGRFGPIQAIRLFEILRHFGPPFQRLAERMPSEPGATSLPRARHAEQLLATIVASGAEARNGAELVTRVSTALQDLLPHDHLEIVVQERRGAAVGWEFLGRDKPARRWGRDPAAAGAQGGSAPRGMDALIEAVGAQDTLVVADLAADRFLTWPFREEGRDAPRIHSLLVAGLSERGRRSGWLFLGSAATDLYRPADEALVLGILPVLAMQAAALHAHAEVEGLRRTVSALEGPGGAIARAVRLLATSPRFGSATEGLATIVRELTGSFGCRFILHLGATEAVAVDAGESRPLLDLPLIPVEGASFAPVIKGDAKFLLRPGGEEEQLILPLRVGAAIIGVMVLTGAAGGRLASMTLTAQQLADTIAPHLELVRREAGVDAGSGKR